VFLCDSDKHEQTRYQSWKLVNKSLKQRLEEQNIYPSISLFQKEPCHLMQCFCNELWKHYPEKRDKFNSTVKKLHHERFHVPYSSLDIIKLIKSRVLKRLLYVVRTGEKRNIYRVWRGNLKE
jgi:hypothetical protein